MRISVYDDAGNFLWSFNDADGELYGDKIIDLLEAARDEAIAKDVDNRE